MDERDKNLVDRALHQAQRIVNDTDRKLRYLPFGESRTVATYAVARALAAIVVHGLGNRLPDEREFADMFLALRKHCEICASRTKPPGTLH